MNILKYIVLVTLFGSPAQADEHDDWMCLFEKLPIEVIEAEKTLGEKKLVLTITNNHAFNFSNLALDFQLVIPVDPMRLERSMITNIWIDAGETKRVDVPFELSDEQIASISMDAPLEVQASIANGLDSIGNRFVVREAIGSSFQVFWPYAAKSKQVCE